jgi:hypothetical protein
MKTKKKHYKKHEGVSLVCVYTGPGVGSLAKINTLYRPPEINRATGVGIIDQGKSKLFFRQYEELGTQFRPSTVKLFEAGLIVLTAQNTTGNTEALKTIVSINIERFAIACGIAQSPKAMKKFLEELRKDLTSLRASSFAWTELRKGKPLAYGDMGLCSSWEIRNGRLKYEFSIALTTYFINRPVSQRYLQSFLVDNKKPNAYAMVRKLQEHYFLKNNQNKGTADIISVRALAESLPAIPSEKEVKSKGRHLYQRRIQPLVSTLEYLEDMRLINWEYCHKKKAPLTADQMNNREYAFRINLYIKFTILPQTEDVVSFLG